MKFNELDNVMRIYETINDQSVLPGIYMVARIDGRSFTRLTKEVLDFEKPFDQRFRDAMVETAQHLMECGFNIIYGYTQSDEISLLFDLNEQAFNRKLRKYNSVLASEAGAKFSLLVNQLASFDCRISQLPTKQTVVDYFRWRNEDAHRNALNGYCYWTLRKDNYSANKANSTLEKLNTSEKNELLFRYGINFNDLPNWQKRGTGLLWCEYEKEALNLISNEKVFVKRRKICINYDLAMKEEYSQFIEAVF